MKKLQDPIDEGWSVHIYDRRRRLLCALEPSHGWTFLLGFLSGLVLAIAWANMADANPDTTFSTNTETETPLLQVD